MSKVLSIEEEEGILQVLILDVEGLLVCTGQQWNVYLAGDKRAFERLKRDTREKISSEKTVGQ